MIVIGDDEVASGKAKIKRMKDGFEMDNEISDLPEQAALFMNESKKEI